MRRYADVFAKDMRRWARRFAVLRAVDGFEVKGETEMKRIVPAGLAVLTACGEAQPPRACGTVPDQETTVGQTVTVHVCFEDPEGGELTFAAVSSPETVATAVASATAVTVRGVSPGTAVVTVTFTAI